MKPLPLGLQTFADLISGGYVYVDKTGAIRELLRPPKGMYFLSRPRRFGKSLLVTTLKAIFEAKRELFEGLAIDGSDYAWQEHPVIHLDMSGKVIENKADLIVHLQNQTERSARAYGLSLEAEGYEDRLGELIEKLSERNRVAILIDEYDKPILDNITEPEPRQQIKDALSGFYGVIKPHDEYLRFVFLTGVSKFTKVSVFSKLNNLEDLTMDGRYADLLGYTQKELEANFAERLAALAEHVGCGRPELLKQIRHWYNGYRFSDRDVKVYNPVSAMRLLDKMRFGNYWFETGTPTFLIELIKSRQIAAQEIEPLYADEDAFSVYDVENLEAEPLLFQTGYLTIQDYSPDDAIYTLSYPNLEVENSFKRRLLSGYSEISGAEASGSLFKLLRALEAGDLDEFFELLRVFFAKIPNTIRIDNHKYYQSIFHLIFTLLGLRTDAEVSTHRGRIDAVIELEEAVYLFEFKLDDTRESALAQIKEREYALPYQDRGKTIHLVGVAFDAERRNIGEWLVESR